MGCIPPRLAAPPPGPLVLLLMSVVDLIRLLLMTCLEADPLLSVFQTRQLTLTCEAVDTKGPDTPRP